MDYATAVMRWLSSKDKFLVLNGPSVAGLAQELPRMKERRPAVIGVNHIFNVERRILQPNGLYCDIWVLFSQDEVERYTPAIVEFLTRPSSVAILTSSFALSRVSDIIEFGNLPNPYKLVLCDSIIETAQRMTSTEYTNPFNYRSDAALNSLAYTLLALSLVPGAGSTAIYLFGCDGADSKEVTNVYFDQDSMDLGPRVISERSIYQDMIAFEAYWGVLIDRFFKRRGLVIPNVLNANPQSEYSVFPKVRISEVNPRGSAEEFTFNPEGIGSHAEIHSELIRSVRATSAALTLTLARSERMLVQLIRADCPRSERKERAFLGSGSEIEEKLSAAMASLAVMSLRLRETQEELVERTRRLEDAGRELVKRTGALDRATADLVRRTDELVEARRLLEERTRLLQAYTKSRAPKTGD